MFNFRYATASTRESLQQRVEAILARHGLDYDARVDGLGQAVPHAARHAGRRRERRRSATSTGVTPELSCTGGTSDGRFIADICPEVVELGPVNASIHKLNERVRDRRPRAARRASTAASSSGCCSHGARTMSTAVHDLETLRDWLRYAVIALRRSEARFRPRHRQRLRRGRLPAAARAAPAARPARAVSRRAG